MDITKALMEKTMEELDKPRKESVGAPPPRAEPVRAPEPEPEPAEEEEEEYEEEEEEEEEEE